MMRKLWSQDVIDGDLVVAFHCELLNVAEGGWAIHIYRDGELWIAEHFAAEEVALAASGNALEELNAQAIRGSLTKFVPSRRDFESTN